MKIQYLGTAAAEGWPALFCRCKACEKARMLGGKDIRTRSQAIIDDTLLVDYPADTMLHWHMHNFSLPEVNHLIITHSHQDHFYPDELALRKEPFTRTPKGILHIYGNDKVGAALTGARESDSKSLIEFHHVLPFEWFEAGAYKVMPLLANHDKKEACYVYIIERDGKRIAYLNDTGYLCEESLNAIKAMKFDLISMDCTTGHESDGNNHMGIPNIPIMMKTLVDLGCTHDKTEYLITHFSHNGLYSHAELEELGKQMGTYVAYDGYTHTI